MASMNLTFLGTGCMVPTNERNHTSLALEYNGKIFLFDCGEATQHQIKKFKVSIGSIKKIFLSHFHGDHVLGLPGLIQTLSNTQGIEKIEIYGPKDAKKFVNHMLNMTIFDSKVPIEIHELKPKKSELLTVLETSEYRISCAQLNHSIPCIGYRFEEKDVLNIDKEKAKELGLENSPQLARAKMALPIEHNGKKIYPEAITYIKKGKKVALVFDTRPCEEINLLAKDADYLVMEATYKYATHYEKAEEYDHMSAKETAEIAAQNGVGELIITHFSQRYKDVTEVEDEARESFENTTTAYDGFKKKLK
ncbi:MAG: ribonuclease Z [Nanoarchaeota archaeon]